MATTIRIVCLVIAVLFGGAPAVADVQSDCAQLRNPELRIAACSDLIARAGKVQRKERVELALIYRRRGSAYLETGKPDKAMADFLQAIQLRPSYALAHANRGYLHEAQGKTGKARADFARVPSLDPTLTGASAGPRRLGGARAAAQSENLVRAGRAVVERHCTVCHATGAVAASPNAKAPPFRAIQNRYPMLMLRDPVSLALAYPKHDMPKFNLTGEQAGNVIAYINLLPPAR
jgi:mono/diheme cytochrome c family protein